VSAIDNLYQQERWKGLKSVVMVVRIRRLWNKTTREIQFYLTSMDSEARSLSNAIRKHWGIENELHWTLDVSFREDDCRIRSFHSPRNFSILRRIAINVLNRETTYKRSLIQKSKRTAMDDDYMVKVLQSGFINNRLDPQLAFCQG
jgi:predicted transposase YbfD/YdcC